MATSRAFLLDLRCAMRTLRLSPPYAIGVAVTIALVIGATTAAFAVVQAVLLKPLPFADPDGLVWIWATRTDRDKAFFSVPDYLDYERGSTTLQQVAAYSSWGANLTGGSHPERVLGAKVTPNAFEVLGARAIVGRLFQPSDNSGDGQRLLVVSQSLWQRRFGGARAVIGSRIQVNGEDHSIIGVLPEGFLFPGVEAELFAPLVLHNDPRRTDRGTNFLRVFGRLHPTTTSAQVSEEWGRISRELRDAYPEPNGKKTEPRVVSLHEEMLGTHRPALTLLLGATLTVWLLACANILNLQMIRLAARQREATVRAALGASTFAVNRPYIVENVTLAAVGGMLGTLLASTLLPFAASVAPITLPRASDTKLDAVVLMFTIGLIAATASASALLPLFQVRRTNLEHVLRAGSRTTVASKTRGRQALVVFEMAAALCLLVSTGLLMQAYYRLQSLEPEMHLDGVLQTRVSLPQSRYASQAALEQFVSRVGTQLLQVHGVSRVACANALPLSGQNIRTDFTIVGTSLSERAEVPGAQNRWVTPGYFETLGIPLVDGRTFNDADAISRAPVAVVDAALAEHFWPDGRAVGTQIRILDGTPEGRLLDIVGIVGNVAHFDVGERPLGTLYGPVHQIPSAALGFFIGNFMIAVNTNADSDHTRRALVEAVRRVDSDVPVAVPLSLRDQLRTVLAARRFVAVTLGAFAAAALLLVVSGVYTVVAAAAREQTRELAIKLALGAPPESLKRSLLGFAVGVLFMGVPLGLGGAALSQRFIFVTTGLQFEDWLVWILAPVVITAAALAASYLCARRVVGVDVAVTLRSE